jgi:serine/threonine protein kinase
MGVCEGMSYIHSNQLVHRDLKPANVLLDKNGMPKICDFGLTRLMSASTQNMTQKVGTVVYSAPEIWNEEYRACEKRIDVYSFAMTMCAVFSRTEPFANERLGLIELLNTITTGYIIVSMRSPINHNSCFNIRSTAETSGDSSFGDTKAWYKCCLPLFLYVYFELDVALL